MLLSSSFHETIIQKSPSLNDIASTTSDTTDSATSTLNFDISTLVSKLCTTLLNDLLLDKSCDNNNEDILLLNPLDYYKQKSSKDEHLKDNEQRALRINKIKILVSSIEKIILITSSATVEDNHNKIIENQKANNDDNDDETKKSISASNNDISASSDSDNNNTSSEEDDDGIVQELLRPKQTIPELRAQKAVEEDRFIKEYYAVQLEKAKNFTAFENGRAKFSNPLDIFEVDDDGFLNLYRNKEKNYLKRLKKRHKIRMKEEATLRRKEREEMKRLEEIERKCLELEQDHGYQRYGGKYIMFFLVNVDHFSHLFLHFPNPS